MTVVITHTLLFFTKARHLRCVCGELRSLKVIKTSLGPALDKHVSWHNPLFCIWKGSLSLHIMLTSIMRLWWQEADRRGERGWATASQPSDAAATTGGLSEDPESTAPTRPSLPTQLLALRPAELTALGGRQQGDVRHLSRICGLTYNSDECAS